MELNKERLEVAGNKAAFFNETNEKGNKCKAIIDLDLLESLCKDLETVMEMHTNLITLYAKESELKKHHKAYLHVRDFADEVCRMDMKKMAEITLKYTNLPVFLDDFVNEGSKSAERSQPEDKDDWKDEFKNQEALKDQFEEKKYLISEAELNNLREADIYLVTCISYLVDIIRTDLMGGEGRRENKERAVRVGSDAALNTLDRWNKADFTLV